MSLFETRIGYKPFTHQWAYDLWKRQNRVHWLVEEIPFGEDIRDWNDKLTDAEKNLLTQVFRFFTQADIEVQDNYQERLSRVFKPTEIKMMLSSFAAMESVHIDAYSHLIDTLGLPEIEYSAFMNYQSMKDKHDYLTQFNVSTPEETAITLATFGGFVEGLQLFASFAIMMNFPRFNKLKGMGQVISWSIRDESLHCEGIIRLYHEFCKEAFGGNIPRTVTESIRGVCSDIVRLESSFVEQAFELGGVQGLEPNEVIEYTKFIADWRLSQLDLPPICGVTNHPLPWLPPLINGHEHANFFETRATEYSKGATQGSWEGVWNELDEAITSAAAVKGYN